MGTFEAKQRFRKRFCRILMCFSLLTEKLVTKFGNFGIFGSFGKDTYVSERKRRRKKKTGERSLLVKTASTFWSPFICSIRKWYTEQPSLSKVKFISLDSKSNTTSVVL